MKTTCGVLVVVLVCITLATETWAQKHMLVLLDRTGSMQMIRINGHSRCHDALDQAKRDVTGFFNENPTGSLMVVTFADDGIVVATLGFVGRVPAMTALNSLSEEGCSGLTPLAEAMCAASDILTVSFPEAPKGTKFLSVSSDGGENNSDGECVGPYSTDCPPPPGNYTPGSWEALVWSKLTAQNTVLVRHWASVTKSGTVIDTETGKQVQACGDQVFFEDVAVASGGTYSVVDDTSPVNPLPCDCVRFPSLTHSGVLVLILMLAAAGIGLRRRAVVNRRAA